MEGGLVGLVGEVYIKITRAPISNSLLKRNIFYCVAEKDFGGEEPHCLILVYASTGQANVVERFLKMADYGGHLDGDIFAFVISGSTEEALEARLKSLYSCVWDLSVDYVAGKKESSESFPDFYARLQEEALALNKSRSIH